MTWSHLVNQCYWNGTESVKNNFLSCLTWQKCTESNSTLAIKISTPLQKHSTQFFHSCTWLKLNKWSVLAYISQTCFPLCCNRHFGVHWLLLCPDWTKQKMLLSWRRSFELFPFYSTLVHCSFTDRLLPAFLSWFDNLAS